MALSRDIIDINSKLEGTEIHIFTYSPIGVNLKNHSYIYIYIGADWVYVNGCNCQTAVLACCAGGHVPVLSYLYTHRGADLRLVGMESILLRLVKKSFRFHGVICYVYIYIYSNSINLYSKFYDYLIHGIT